MAGKRVRGSNSSGGKAKSTGTQEKINFKLKHDEEISSGEDSDLENLASPPQSEDEDDELARESAESKRRRLAKQYLEELSRVDAAERSESEEEEDGLAGAGRSFSLSERLKKERQIRSGRYYRDLSHQFASLSVEKECTTRHHYGHTGALTCVSLSPDETHAVTGGKDNSVIRWDLETGEKQMLKRKWRRSEDGVTPANEGEVLAVATSSDGRYVASGGRDGLVRVYDARQEHAEVQAFRGHRGAVTSLAFRNGTYALFSGSADRCVKYWDLNEMAYIETAFGHQDEITSIDCWHKARPVTGSVDRSVRLWKIEESSHLVYRGAKSSVDTVQSLTEESFVSGSQDGRLALWNAAKKTSVSHVLAAHGVDEAGVPRWISALSTIKASDSFASGSNDGFVRVWSVAEDRIQPAAQFEMKGFVNGLALSSKMLVAACSREHRLGRWWNERGARDRLTVVRFGGDLADRIPRDDDEESGSDDSEDGSDLGSDYDSEVSDE